MNTYIRATVALTAGALAAAFVSSASAGDIKGVTALTKVFGEGQKLVAAAVEYDREINDSKLDPAAFRVEGRTVMGVHAATSPTVSGERTSGRYVIVELSPNDPGAALFVQQKRDIIRKKAELSVLQSGPVVAASGETIAPASAAVPSTAVVNSVADDFKPLEYKDAKTGDTLKYNLFTPKNYDPKKSYPLVLFMHDAGTSSDVIDTTLAQGLGAISWASPEDQAKHEAFVLAPQYSTPIVNDNSEASSFLDTTIDLVNDLAGRYSVDRDRLYVTGQSGGAMMLIAMNIKRPDLFAASFIVAGQWDPATVAPLARKKLWIIVSEGDLKAYPGENAITAALEKEGAKISRAVWDGTSTPDAFATLVSSMDAQNTPINYVALKKGTVVPPGQDDDGGSNHVNTWRIAYTIDGIRDWIFKQHK